LVLDTNEYILGIPANKTSCAELVDQLGALKVYVPSIVVKEVRNNFQRHYELGKEFFHLISKKEKHHRIMVRAAGGADSEVHQPRFRGRRCCYCRLR
jgi:hypothetical protein